MTIVSMETERSATLTRSEDGELQVHFERTRDLLDEVDRLNIRGFEALSAQDLCKLLVPQIKSWLHRSLQLIGSVAAAVDGGRYMNMPAPGHLSLERQMDSLMIAAASQCIVSDVAFVAGLELSQRVRRLDGLSEQTSALEILTHCDGAVRRIKKSLRATDDALAVSRDGFTRTDHSDELLVSLRVRRAYARLRQSVSLNDEPESAELVSRMRHAAASIAKLGADAVYLELRVGDRAQIRALLHRLRSWLAGTPDLREGVHLWQDLTSFIRMLTLINNRQELLAHDVNLLGELAHELSLGNMNADTFARMARLRGLDDELDAMLENASVLECEDWLSVLSRLRSYLGQEGLSSCS